jgi:hypothetical protein
MQGERAHGRGRSRRMAGAEGKGEIGGGVGVVETISRAHAGLAAILAFVLGALVTWMVPAMVRDARAWHDELWARPRR